MEDEEKLRISVDAFERKLRSIDSWIQFKGLLQTVTKAQIKNFIKSNLQAYAQSLRDSAIAGNANAEEIDSVADEIEGL